MLVSIVCLLFVCVGLISGRMRAGMTGMLLDRRAGQEFTDGAPVCTQLLDLVDILDFSKVLIVCLIPQIKC